MTFIVPSSAERTATTAPSHEGAVPGRKVFLWAFGFACFLPYPALAIGSKTGLQASHVLALVAFPFLAAGPPGRPLFAALVAVVPGFVSAFVNAMRNAPEASVLPKEAIAIALALCVLWPAEWVDSRSRFRTTLGAAAAAILLHAAIGAYQVYAFSKDEFPLLFLFRNPSFKSMESWADLYARYMKRPCGLFPEPSAMASSLGPWLVVIAGLVSDPTPGARLGLSNRGRRLFTASAAAGFVLLALSRSGSTVAVMAAVAAACLANAGRWSRAYGRGALVAVLLLSVLVGGVLGYFVATVGSNLDGRIESSWGLRGASIVAGLTANTAALDLAFGVGPGQSTPVVRKMLAGLPRAKDQDDLAIYSLAVTYYMETGLLGLLAVLAVSAVVIRSVFRSSAVVLGLSALGAWLVGVSFTTSYMPLSAVWLFLGSLLNWDRVFPGRPPAGGAGQ